jgi:Cu-Zn family superoxide dismutase
MAKSVRAAVLVTPLALLTACTPYEPIATQPGTPPPIWTGSPAPAAAADGHLGVMHGGTGHLDAPAAAGPTDTLSALIRNSDGTQVAAATIDFSGGFATVTVQTTGAGGLAPGPHGLHIHAVGKCETNSVAPAGGPPGDFLSAGGHFVGGGTSHPSHAGDLSSLQVRPDGTAMLVTTSSAFTRDQLLAAPGTAIIIHEGADNFANIPADRYQQTNGTAPPDAATLATGDAGKRVACGVLGAG